VVSPYTDLFGYPAAKNFKDSNAYRLGVSYKATNIMTLMAGVAYDETPVPSGTLGFELPDSDAWLFSLGARFKVTPKMDLGFGLLYDKKTDRAVNNVSGSPTDVAGKFTDASALYVSAGLSYTF
jgi:long-chain fatty acid transport protein